MKKRNLKSLTLNKKSISDLNVSNVIGGATRFSCGVKCPFGAISDTMDNNCNGPC